MYSYVVIFAFTKRASQRLFSVNAQKQRGVSSAVMMQAGDSLEASVPLYLRTRGYTQEDRNLSIH